MGDKFEIYEAVSFGVVYGYGIRQADDQRPLLLPNNDWVMFEDKESAETVCDLLNRKGI